MWKHFPGFLFIVNPRQVRLYLQIDFNKMYVYSNFLLQIKMKEKGSGEENCFVRALSKREFDRWINDGEVYEGTEWSKIHDDDGRGYGLKMLKEEWVDVRAQRKENDLHEIIIGVRAKIEEFVPTPMMIPLRYRNLICIPMDRIKVIYDPYKKVTTEGVFLDMDDPEKLLR